MTEVSFEKRILARDLLQNYFVQPDISNRRIDKQSGAFIISGLSKNQKEIEEKIMHNVVWKIKINNQEEITVPWFIGEERNDNHKKPIVELRKSDREYSLDEFKPKVINIPDYVEIIEAGVFDGLKDVTIKTSFESKPEGWEDGWNGSCKVEWGVKINY